MRRLAGRFAFCSLIVLSAAANEGASANDGACVQAGWGDGYRKVVHEGETWTYILKAPGPNWQIGPPDRHTQGHISCESCGWGAAPRGAIGPFYWGISNGHLPPTAAERAARRNEGIPGIVFGPNRLEVKGTREPVSLGPLSGYAVLYRVALPRLPKENERPAVEGSLLALYLKDACIEFDLTLQGRLSTGGDDWRPLESLLGEVTITKSPTADVDIPKK